MRNLVLQGEVRHVLPTTRNDISSEENTSNTKIVAVIQNTNTDHNIPISLNNFDYGTDNNNSTENTLERPKQPPVSFVVTSDGYLLALDVNDELVWRVDLEKVAVEDDEEDYEGDGTNTTIVRSQWFYAASFLQENPPDENADDIINLANEEGLHITCLSHAGHVVSVSIDATNTIANSGGIVEEGSECIGSFDNGLSCGGWSIDGEVLALVTFASDEDEEENNENKDDGVKVPILMTMNTQYEVLSEVRLEPTLVSDAITFCWRPDSSSLAISTMDANVNDKPLRRIRTYHRTTLQLLSLSKEEDGSGRDVPNLLPVPPAWAPAGCSHFVGAVQSSRPISMKSSRARITMQVAFMEPNGLRHTMCKIHSTVSSPKTDKEDVEGIAFNLEGDLLAVTSKVTTTSESSEYGKVQLYHRNNYHWYLKYELRYDGKGAGSSSSSIVSNIKFSTENPYQLMVALNQGGGVLEWREYTYRWESSTVHYRHHQSPSSSSSSVLAMAIDGKKLNFTPLDKAIIPPPMYASSLELQAPVVGITSRPCFYNEEIKGSMQVDFIIALSDGKLALLQCGGGDNAMQQEQGVSLCPGFQPPSLLAIVDPCTCGNIEDDETITGSGLSLQNDLSLRDITIIDADDDSLTIIALMGNKGGKHTFVDNLIEMKISLIDETGDNDVVNAKSNVLITSSVELEGRALRIVNWADTAYSAGARGSALLELTNGSLLEYSKGGVLESCEAGAFLEPCPWISGVYDAASSATVKFSDNSPEDHAGESSSDRLVIGLSNRYRLYCGERLLSSASSSFDISLEHQFIAHVTIGSQPQLRFLPISSLHNFDSFMGSDDQNMALDGYEPRSVERGARLVAIFSSKPSVVLQMPRGNLEAISPRALVLPYIMVKIQEDDFLTALDIMRRQRVDMNLIVDLDPSHFLDKGGAEKFIGQIEKIDNINLFLSSLIDVDTTLWKYPIPSWIGVDKGLPLVDKVNKVCTKMRQVMLDAEKEGVITTSGKIIKEGHFLLPILSTFAKESPPKLEEALSLIKNSATHVPKKSKSVLLSEKVQSSIQYLAFLANYELLFDTAIGMYDFELAKAVARHSQMDPKVYLPMLKRWRELPESTARYEVDVKLKRYESALHHLVASSNQKDEVKASNDEEDHITKCLKFIEEHGLHKLGLQLFRNDKDSHRQIMISLGERLLSERKSEEALTIFLATTPHYLDGAKRASRACGDWRTYFTCCAEDEEVLDNDKVSAMAESISSKIGNMKEQRENYASAATILLEYGEDVSYAIDMLISAHMWSEGRRIANRYKRADLVKKVVDGAVSYARTCIEDISERSTSFEEANKRYAEVIVIRREAVREAEEAGLNDLHHDDSASMFSMQSTASNTSLRSNASGTSVGSVGSIGSVASVSTVISVGANSTFSFTGDRDTMKHKSKFNNIGRDKKKKKKQRNKASRRKMKPGSEEELTGLVETLTHACPDDHYVDVISETITFLLQVDKKSMATLLFESYKDLTSVVEQSQVGRLTKDNEAKIEREKEDRKEGRIYENVEHPCEKDINAIKCLPLNKSVESALSFLL